jgi:hypothetical protein
MKAKRILIAVDALLVAILACNLPSSQSPLQQPDLAGTITAQAMILLQSSDTPAFTSTPAFTNIPSLTPTNTLTPTPSVPQGGVSAATNCRTGPGTVYDLVYTMQPGQSAELIGKYTPLNYWIIKMPGGGTCWLWGQYAVVSGNIANLPEYPPPPTPTPSLPLAPSAFKVNFHCTLTSSPFIHNDVHVNMSWQDNAANESGFYVFRDDALLATLGTNQTSLSDDTTMVAIIIVGSPPPHITYSIQAFNAAGKSKKISKSISCFE